MAEMSLFQQAELTETSLTLAGDIEDVDYTKIGEQLARIGDCSQWWIGDWLRAGHKHNRGEDGWQTRCERAGINYNTAKNHAAVCQAVEFARRRANLSFSHHEVVTAHDAGEQDYWLNQAQQHDWPVSELRKRVRLAKEMRDKGTGKHDCLGNELCERLVPAFAIRQNVLGKIKSFCDDLNLMAASRGGDRLGGIQPQVEALVDAAEDALPHGICPSCFGRQCDLCDGRGWMTESECKREYDKMPVDGMTLEQQRESR